MPKTTFDTGAKTITATPSTEESTSNTNNNNVEEFKDDGSAFESLGASGWKAITSSVNPMDPETYPIDSMSEFLEDWLSQTKTAVDAGTLSTSLTTTDNNPLNVRIKRSSGKEYLDYFEAVTLPPSLTALDPDNDPAFKDSYSSVDAFYRSYLDCYTQRKTDLEKYVATGTLTADQLKVTKQLLSDLDKGIVFVNKQLDGLMQKYNEETNKA